MGKVWMSQAVRPKCALCGFEFVDENALDGHVRNVHGWKMPCGCVPNLQDGGYLSKCVVHSLPQRCDYALPGLGRCVDDSGAVHGHHFKPGQLDQALVLSIEEARELTAYMAYQYVNPNLLPVLSALLTRIEAHVRVTA